MNAAILFILSICISTTILLIFRQLDKNNRSFDKVSRLYKTIKEDLSKFSEERYTELEDFDKNLESSMKKGSNLLETLSKATTHIEKNAVFDENVAKRLTQIESEIEKITAAPNSQSAAPVNAGSSDRKEMRNEMKIFKNEIANMTKNLDKKKKEITEYFKGVETKNKIEFDSRKNEIFDFIKLQESIFIDNSKRYNADIDKINGQITKLNNKYVKEAEKEYELITENYKMKFEDFKNSYENLENEAQNNLETKINDYSAYVARLESRAEGLSEKIIKNLENKKSDYLLDLKELDSNLRSDYTKHSEKMRAESKNYILKLLKDNEDKYKTYYDNFKKIESSSQLTIKDFESFIAESSDKIKNLKDYTYKEIDERLKDFNLHINNSNEMGIRLELEIFNNIKTKLEAFRSEVLKNIGDVKSGIDNNINTFETQINNKYSGINSSYSDLLKKYDFLTKEIDDIKNNFNAVIADFSDKQKSIFNQISENNLSLKNSVDEDLKNQKIKYETDKEAYLNDLSSQFNLLEEKKKTFKDDIMENLEKYKNLVNTNLMKIKGYFDVEKEKTFQNIDKSLLKLNNDADDKTLEISEKFDKTYSEFEKKLKSIHDNMVEKALEIEKDLLGKSASLNDSLDDKIEKFKVEMNDKRSKFEQELINENNEIIFKINSFKDEVSSKLNESSQFIDQNISESSEKINTLKEDFTQKMSNIETFYFDKGKELLDANKEKLDGFISKFNDINENIYSLKMKIENEVTALSDNGIALIGDLFTKGSSELSDKYKKLSSESDSKIAEYRAELVKIKQNFKFFDEKYDQKFDGKIEEYNKKFDTKLDMFSEKYKIHLNEVFDKTKSAENNFTEKISQIEKEYFTKTEQLIDGNNNHLSEFVVKFNDLSDKLQEMKLKIDIEVGKKIDDGKIKLLDEYKIFQAELDDMMNKEIENTKEKYKKTEDELNIKLLNYKKDVTLLQNNIKQIDDKFTGKFLEHSSFLDKKINNINENIKNFEKSTGLFDRAYAMKDKLSIEIDAIKDEIKNIKQDREKILEVEKKLMNIDDIAKSSIEKSALIISEKKKIDTIAEVLNALKELSDSAFTKIDDIKNAKVLLSNIDQKIEETSQKYNSLEEYIGSIIEKETEMRALSDNIVNLNDKFVDYNQKVESINKKIEDLEFKRVTYEKSFKTFEKDASLITKSEAKVAEVIDKFNQMDSLIEDLEMRTEYVNKIREWLVKAETNIENMNNETDKKIKLLESLMSKSAESPLLKEIMKDDFEKKEIVLQLQSQGWTIDDIAKNLELSVGEVELILDLEYPRKR
ncbi:MAG TPA: hypothetical protein PLG34_08385 [Spirochaetota bacterium]|nr:MAG: Apolipoprotein A1/A4/E domain protein [Spirochaetes bacterium ADurb.Bin133]HNZ26229.1 hypothetical protein [Spirochaetota bacterium]HPY87983.1 hypothetical protein [Spirochaetota bacterium]HQB60953.1 hypothetical protein [Spirochaetota bacterium]